MSDQCPRLQNTRAAELTNMYPAWEEARRYAPVFWDEHLNCWQITTYADVVTASMNTSELSSTGFWSLVQVHPGNEHLLPRGFEYEAPTLINADPPTHTRLRKLANGPFKPKRVAMLEPEIRAIADQLIDDFINDGRCDLVEQFTVPLSLLTIARILGMPESDCGEMRRYSDERPASLNPNLTKEQQAELFEHYGTYYDFLERAIHRTRENPGDNLLARLVEEADKTVESEDQTSEAELVSLVSQLIGAGNETTRYQISNLMLMLFRHPEQLAAVRDDPELATAAVEESLRYFGSVKGNFRVATSDIQFGEVKIPEGSLVQICWASTGRDEAVFDDPNRFDIYRPDRGKHIAFSKGPHACLGAPLARLEATIALQQLLRRLPGLRMTHEPLYPADYVESVQVHGIAHLNVAWEVPPAQ
jgi:cytochrome P450